MNLPTKAKPRKQPLIIKEKKSQGRGWNKIAGLVIGAGNEKIGLFTGREKDGTRSGTGIKKGTSTERGPRKQPPPTPSTPGRILKKK